jgi:hypothetical protein
MEQVDRANRYLKRMRGVYGGVFLTSDDRDLYEDDVLSFFMHCFHIRDWILHLNQVGITAQQLDLFINRHEALRVCADLCNGTKHCKLKRSTRSGRQPHVATKSYASTTWLTGSGGGNAVKGKYTILTASGPVDALELGEECMLLWGEFIEQARNSSFDPTATRD